MVLFIVTLFVFDQTIIWLYGLKDTFYFLIITGIFAIIINVLGYLECMINNRTFYTRI